MKIKILLTISLVLALALPALAATTNPSPASPGYATIVIPLKGYSTSRTGVAKFKAPAGYSVKSASIAARAITGTTPTVKVRGKNGSLVNYSGSIASTGPTDLKLADESVLSDEVTQSIDLIVGGTGVVIDDLWLTLFLKRK